MSFLNNLFNKSPRPQEVAKPSVTQTRLGVREPYFFKEYYDEVMTKMVLFTENTEKQYQQLIAEKGADFDGLKTSEFMLSDDFMIRLTIAYSRGDSIPTLIPLYRKAVYHFIRSWNPENIVYNDLLRIVSVGLLLEPEGESLSQIADLLTQEKFTDAIINHLLHSVDSKLAATSTIMFPEDKGLALLYTILQANKEEAAKGLKLYLEKYWYTVDNLDVNYNSHANPKKDHFGYWAFESGAITRNMGLNDSSYKDNQFYPGDLVHWQSKP